MARHAVVHVVEPRELILVDLRRLPDTGIKPRPRKRSGSLFFLRKAFPDRLRLAAATAIVFLQTALAKISIELFHVLHARHRRGPFPLQRLDAIFHHRLFIASRGHAEQRIEHIVTGERLITWIDLPRPPGQQRLGHRLRIVPPDFFRHAPEKIKRLRHALQDRFGSLSRQSDREGKIGIRPHQDQHVDLPAAVREIHPDLAEIRFDPLTRPMIQRDERLGLVLPMPIHKPPHGIIPARVSVFVPDPLEDSHPRMPLLGRRGFILFENLQDAIMKPSQLGSRLLPTFRIRRRLALAPQDLANLFSRMVKCSGNFPEAHAIAISPTNPCIIVHREHPLLR